LTIKARKMDWGSNLGYSISFARMGHRSHSVMALGRSMKSSYLFIKFWFNKTTFELSGYHRM
jgi:hypothetical protein